MSLPVTTELIQRTASALGDGGWRYTPRQLYYATCAAAETPHSRGAANGLLALGVLLVLVAFILLRVPVAFVTLLALAGLVLITGAVARFRYRPPSGRVLAISYAAFERLLRELMLPALIDVGGWRAASLPTTGPVVVCDTDESAAALGANSSLAGMEGVGVLGRARAVGLKGRDVVALHDASPRGCALPLELSDQGANVLDAGLRPRWVDGTGFQELEGAPARLPRDLNPAVDDAEVGWLASGRRVELAVLRPPRLASLATAGLDALQQRKAHPDASQADAPGLLPSLPAFP
ncbi:MAG: hypothetical protein ABR498_03705 [Candidatus Dormibacteria bacterium]